MLTANVPARIDVPNERQVNIEEGCAIPVGQLVTHVWYPEISLVSQSHALI